MALALRLAARSVGRTETALGSFYRRIRGRIGAAGAITATAHKLARLVYQLLKHGQAYVTTSQAAYEAAHQTRQEQSLRRRTSSLGFDLRPQPMPPT